jgi:hypothetical protein
MHLIGPDGKIAAIDYDIDEMRKAVGEFLNTDK